jgi:hypothetical protein
MKKLVTMAVLSIVAAAALAEAAGPCAPTPLFRDGNFLTAAVINPPGTFSATVDATGCNIGVYYDAGGTGGSVSGATIFGSNYYGIAVNGESAAVSIDVKASSVHDIGETPFNGVQHGVGIYYVGSATGEVNGNQVYAYQKGGIVANGTGINVTVTDNVVTGLGPVNFIAQNGIQIGFGGNGVVRGNEISGNFYTGTAGVGPNPGGQNPPGWQYVSGGLLLYQTGNVKHSQNKYAGNQANILMVP